MVRLAARFFVWATGWQPEGSRPVDARYVLIAAPHTSNWDLAYLLAFAILFDVKIAWMGKHALFRPPLGWLMRAVGGIPIRRNRAHNVVTQSAMRLKEAETLALVVPAEGTRGRVEFWKSGFYHIATEAQVPIVMGYLDWPRKRGGFGPGMLPTGDIRRDMDEIRAFYADKQGRYPELFATPRLKEEA